jgi:hypothetical protein
VGQLVLAFMPCFLGNEYLERRSELELGVRVLAHMDLKREPSQYAFRDAMVEGLERCRPRLKGWADSD